MGRTDNRAVKPTYFTLLFASDAPQLWRERFCQHKCHCEAIHLRRNDAVLINNSSPPRGHSSGSPRPFANRSDIFSKHTGKCFSVQGKLRWNLRPISFCRCLAVLFAAPVKADLRFLQRDQACQNARFDRFQKAFELLFRIYHLDQNRQVFRQTLDIE